MRKIEPQKLYREFIRWTSKICTFQQIFHKTVVRWPWYRSTTKCPPIFLTKQSKDVSWHNYKNIHTVPATGPQNKPFPKKQLQVKKCILFHITKYQSVVSIDYKITQCRGIRIPESVKFFLVESGILGFGIQNKAQGIRNPTKDLNPESTKKDSNQLPGIRNPRRGILKSRTVLHSLTWGKYQLCSKIEREQNTSRLI